MCTVGRLTTCDGLLKGVVWIGRSGAPRDGLLEWIVRVGRALSRCRLAARQRGNQLAGVGLGLRVVPVARVRAGIVSLRRRVEIAVRGIKVLAPETGRAICRLNRVVRVDPKRASRGRHDLERTERPLWRHGITPTGLDLHGRAENARRKAVLLFQRGEVRPRH